MHKMILAFTILMTLPSIVNGFCFSEQEDIYGINANLLRSISETEANLKPKVISKNRDGSVDIGLMQINSSWISPLGLDRERLVNDPCYNVNAGARILQMCIVKHGYTWEAVGCYNAVSRVKRTRYSWKVYNQLKKYEKRLVVNSDENHNNPRGSDSSLSFSARDKWTIE